MLEVPSIDMWQYLMSVVWFKFSEVTVPVCKSVPDHACFSQLPLYQEGSGSAVCATRSILREHTASLEEYVVWVTL